MADETPITDIKILDFLGLEISVKDGIKDAVSEIPKQIVSHFADLQAKENLALGITAFNCNRDDKRQAGRVKPDIFMLPEGAKDDEVDKVISGYTMATLEKRKKWNKRLADWVTAWKLAMTSGDYSKLKEMVSSYKPAQEKQADGKSGGSGE